LHALRAYVFFFGWKYNEIEKKMRLLNFQKANHSTINSGRTIKWNGNFQEEMFENLGALSKPRSLSI